MSKQARLGTLWLLLLGALIWMRAATSTQPPIYDASGYYWKGFSFWQMVSSGHWTNPFDVKPALRPPGTILMTFPLGADQVNNYRPYYFRSVYLALLPAAVAAYLVTLAYGQWTALLAAIFLSCLPCWYHFEYPHECGYWGMADNFHAGVASLATACMILAVRAGSLPGTFLAAFLASFCLLIKPSGLLVMAVLGTAWLLLTVGRRHWRYLALGLPIWGTTYLVTCAVCFHTAYLTENTISYERNVVAWMHANRLNFDVPFLRQHPGFLLYNFHHSLGVELTVGILLLLVLAPWYCRKPPSVWAAVEGPPIAYVAAALVALAVGASFAFWVDGMQQIRYFVVFALIATVLCLPLAAALLCSMPAAARYGLCLMILLRALGLSATLLPGQSFAQLQSILGVHVSTGLTAAEEDTARAFVRQLSEAGDAGRPPEVCSLTWDAGNALFMAAAGLYPQPREEKAFHLYHPEDPMRPLGVSLESMLQADYVLFTPITDIAQRDSMLRSRAFLDYYDEIIGLEAFLTGCDARQGLTMNYTMPHSQLDRVSDRRLFEASLQEFVDSHRWRPQFYQDNPRHWLTEKEARRMGRGLEAANFGAAVYVEAFAMTRRPDLLLIRVLWRRLPGMSGRWLIGMSAKAGNGETLGYTSVSLVPVSAPSELYPIRMSQTSMALPQSAPARTLEVVAYDTSRKDKFYTWQVPVPGGR